MDWFAGWSEFEGCMAVAAVVVIVQLSTIAYHLSKISEKLSAHRQGYLEEIWILQRTVADAEKNTRDTAKALGLISR